MKKYSAHEEGTCSEIGGNFEKILKREGFLIYLGQGIHDDIELGGVAVFNDDIGRGGGGIDCSGEIYGAIQFMATAGVAGVIGGYSFELSKKFITYTKKLFNKARGIGETLHFNVDVEGNSQYHFIFFSYFDEDDFENGWEKVPAFISDNRIQKNVSVDCYFDTKKCKWHIVGERDLSNEHNTKHQI